MDSAAESEVSWIESECLVRWFCESGEEEEAAMFSWERIVQSTLSPAFALIACWKVDSFSKHTTFRIGLKEFLGAAAVVENDDDDDDDEEETKEQEGEVEGEEEEELL